MPSCVLPGDKSHHRQIFLPHNLLSGHHEIDHMIQVIYPVFCTVTSSIVTFSPVWVCPPSPSNVKTLNTTELTFTWYSSGGYLIETSNAYKQKKLAQFQLLFDYWKQCKIFKNDFTLDAHPILFHSCSVPFWLLALPILKYIRM